ncbi:hypothetical protein CGSHiII_00050 [Haemophilus influenzae PittII]|nr:hypothetical protein CGSHiII_00050 [Haemophilus influenzae PittII]
MVEEVEFLKSAHAKPVKNGAVAESGAQAGEYPNVDISKHIC